MQYRIFQYPLPCAEEPEELNRYLAGHRIVSVAHHVVESGPSPMLVFVVQVAAGGVKPAEPGNGRAERVDYKEVLPEGQFAVFSRLREERKRLAAADGVPIYAVFSNAQLAAMVQNGAASMGDLGKIEGIGKARVEKYGAAMVSILAPDLGGKGEGK